MAATSDNPSVRGARGGYAVGRRRRELIIAEATVQFSQLGFNQATILSIANACGISRAGLLHHFPTKEALLAAVLEDRDEADRASFRHGGPPDTTGLGVLRRMVELAAHNAEQPGLISLYAVLAAEAAAPSHPAHDYFVTRYRRISDGTAQVLCRARSHGLLRDDVDPQSAALQLTAMMDGLQVMWLLDPDAIDMPGQLREAIDRLLKTPLEPD